MIPQGFLKHTILAVATETGSAKAMMPVLLELASKNIETKAWLPEGVISLFDRYAKVRNNLRLRAVSSRMEVDDIVGSFTPDLILLGTTPEDSLDRRLTLYARQKGIRTFAIVDERYGFRRRFAHKNGQWSYLTDGVALMDGDCRQKAIAEGLPSSLLHVTGSPLLSFLFFETHSYLNNGDPKKNSLSNEHKQIAFISEPFRRDNGSGSRSGYLEVFLGFTEDTVRNDILTALESYDQPVSLIERIHPSDNRAPKEKRIQKSLVWKQIRDGDLWSYLQGSDLVIGMRSMALLEAALLGCRVASYQPGLIGDNNCAAVRFGLAQEICTPDELRDWIFSNLSGGRQKVTLGENLSFIRRDAAKSVAERLLKDIPTS
jgi:hypothetical protein